MGLTAECIAILHAAILENRATADINSFARSIMRRLNRVVNKEDSVYPPLLSKSPLILHCAVGDGVASLQGKGRIVRGVPSPAFACHALSDQVLSLRAEAEGMVPAPKKEDFTKALTCNLLRRILSFLGDSPRDLARINAVNRAWRQASMTTLEEVTVFQDIIDARSDTRGLASKLSSFTSFLSSCGRGQHLKRLVLMDSHGVYNMSQQFKGPALSSCSIVTLLSNTPNLSVVDVRGIEIRDFIPISDRFLSSLHLLTPCLRTLKLGAHFMRNWPVGWWTRLPYLSDFVVGSRREDADWDDASGPLCLHDDFFAMIRSPAHVWSSIKLWIPLSHSSFLAILTPAVVIPRVCGLTLNASGNCQVKPLDEGFQDVPRDEKKKIEKNAKKGAQIEELTQARGTFPSLVSFTIADVMDRPDLSVEIMGKMIQQAPSLKHFNVTNTHRTAPTHIEPPTVKGRKSRRIQ